ncbi:MAG: hypothetical protein LUQ07_02755 [Methanospirillum sp.]|nr:hypothetical protein [Methanospirillum sp.]
MNGPRPAMVHKFNTRRAASGASGLACVFADLAGNTTGTMKYRPSVYGQQEPTARPGQSLTGRPVP